jgi:hypothetical protein
LFEVDHRRVGTSVLDAHSRYVCISEMCV